MKTIAKTLGLSALAAFIAVTGAMAAEASPKSTYIGQQGCDDPVFQGD